MSANPTAILVSGLFFGVPLAAVVFFVWDVLRGGFPPIVGGEACRDEVASEPLGAPRPASSFPSLSAGRACAQPAASDMGRRGDCSKANTVAPLSDIATSTVLSSREPSLALA